MIGSVGKNRVSLQISQHCLLHKSSNLRWHRSIPVFALLIPSTAYQVSLRSNYLQDVPPPEIVRCYRRIAENLATAQVRHEHRLVRLTYWRFLGETRREGEKGAFLKEIVSKAWLRCATQRSPENLTHPGPQTMKVLAKVKWQEAAIQMSVIL